MKEDFLHYIWKFKKFEIRNLKTTDGSDVEIRSFGQHNTDAGPDFLNAQIKLNGALWSGHIEIHIKSSDWKKHNHSTDPNYENVILHVVYEHDTEIVYQDQSEVIPTIQLKDRVDLDLYNRYQYLLTQNHWIPCASHLNEIDKNKIKLSYYNLAIERLAQKSKDIALILDKNNNDWDQSIFIAIARGFGLKVNSDAFQALAESIPINTLRKHRSDQDQLEALLFGQAGLLSNPWTEAYPESLKKEYSFLQHKHNLTHIPAVHWKFLRLRPANFPTIRISQFAALIGQDISFFSLIMERPIADVHAAFSEVVASSYWEDHYLFDKKVDKKMKKKLGNTTIDLILINSIAPLLFLYGKMHNNDTLIEKSIHLLESIKPEKNSIITKWKSMDLIAESAFDTQSLLQLKKMYCNNKKCLQCSIGYQILSTNS